MKNADPQSSTVIGSESRWLEYKAVQDGTPPIVGADEADAFALSCA
jgi:hypothetical protein